MTKPLDPDVKALGACVRALKQSTSRRMVRANLVYLWDRFIKHPKDEDLAAEASSEESEPRGS